MSGFGAPGGRAINIKPTPPEKGSFPLDHDGECKHLITAYLRCLKRSSDTSNGKTGVGTSGVNTEECRELAREYLGCRMETGLMARDTWGNLGFDKEEGDGLGSGQDRKQG